MQVKIHFAHRGTPLILENLNSVDWSKLTHAYGSAANVPAQIRALLSEDPGRREKALETLYGSICHQGTVWEATGPAASFLVELLRCDAVRGKELILAMLTDLATGTSFWTVDDDSSTFFKYHSDGGPDSSYHRWAMDAHRAVGRGAELYSELTGHTDAAVRAAAAHALAPFPELAGLIVPPILQRLQDEPDPTVQKSLILTLANYGEEASAAVPILERTLASRDRLTRATAAMALAHISGAHLSVDAVEILLDTLRDSVELQRSYAALPWDALLPADLVISLGQLRAGPGEHAIERLIHHLRSLQKWDPIGSRSAPILDYVLGGDEGKMRYLAERVAGALLALAFNQGEAKPELLTAWQQRVLRALAATAPWSPRLESGLKRRGLPTSRTELQELCGGE